MAPHRTQEATLRGSFSTMLRRFVWASLSISLRGQGRTPAPFFGFADSDQRCVQKEAMLLVGFFAGMPVTCRTAYRSDAPCLVPHFDRGTVCGGKSPLRLLQSRGIRRAFDDLQVFDMAVFVEQVASVGDHASLSADSASLVLVTRRQVQPVSLQTRSSPAPGAPEVESPGKRVRASIHSS